jgi:hypothetical protein
MVDFLWLKSAISIQEINHHIKNQQSCNRQSSIRDQSLQSDIARKMERNSIYKVFSFSVSQINLANYIVK